MEIKVFNKTSQEIKLEICGETHTLLNALKFILLEDERVIIATYDNKHPGISNPILYIRTDGTDPVIALNDASTILSKQCTEFKRKFKKKAEDARQTRN
ncbi:DNA-directed RNA polymerase subunit L [Halobacteriota archaeon]